MYWRILCDTLEFWVIMFWVFWVSLLWRWFMGVPKPGPFFCVDHLVWQVTRTSLGLDGLRCEWPLPFCILQFGSSYLMEMCVFVDGHLRITLTTNSTEKMENSSWCKTDCFSSHRGSSVGVLRHLRTNYQRAFLVRVSSLTLDISVIFWDVLRHFSNTEMLALHSHKLRKPTAFKGNSSCAVGLNLREWSEQECLHRKI